MVDENSEEVIEGEGFVLRRPADEPEAEPPPSLSQDARSLITEALRLTKEQAPGLDKAEALLGVENQLRGCLPDGYREHMLEQAYTHLKETLTAMITETDDAVFQRQRGLTDALVHGFCLVGKEDRAIETVELLGGGMLPTKLVMNTPEGGQQVISLDSPDDETRELLNQHGDFDKDTKAIKAGARGLSYIYIFHVTGSEAAKARADVELAEIESAEEGEATNGVRSILCAKFFEAYLGKEDFTEAGWYLKEVSDAFPPKRAMINRLLIEIVRHDRGDDLEMGLSLLKPHERPSALAWLANQISSASDSETAPEYELD